MNAKKTLKDFRNFIDKEIEEMGDEAELMRWAYKVATKISNLQNGLIVASKDVARLKREKKDLHLAHINSLNKISELEDELKDLIGAPERYTNIKVGVEQQKEQTIKARNYLRKNCPAWLLMHDSLRLNFDKKVALINQANNDNFKLIAENKELKETIKKHERFLEWLGYDYNFIDSWSEE